MKEEKKYNQNLKNYHYEVSTNKLLHDPHSEDSRLNSEVNDFLKSNPEFQDILKRNNTNLKDIKKAIYGRAARESKKDEEKEPSYIKLYITELSNLIELKEIEKKVLLALIEADFITIKGFIHLNSDRKRIIAKLLKHKDLSNIYPALTKLQQPLKSLNNTPVLARIENDENDDKKMEKYYINPFLIGSGSWVNVKNRRLRITLDYQNDGRKMTIENLKPITNFNTETETREECTDTSSFELEMGEDPFQESVKIPYGNNDNDDFSADIPF